VVGVDCRQQRKFPVEHGGDVCRDPTLQSYETTFQYDLNGDGRIGPPPPPRRVIESTGVTSLVEVGSNFFLYPVGGPSGPELTNSGAPFSAGQYRAWLPVLARSR
jgi:serralysin